MFHQFHIRSSLGAFCLVLFGVVLKCLVSGCTTALYNVEMDWNGWQWCRTSHIHNSNHANIPNARHPMLPACYCHLTCLLNCPQGKLGCISCTGPAVWQSLFLCTPRQIQLSSSFLFTCNWTSPKSDCSALVTLTKKGRKVSKTWWDEWIIGWRKLEHFTALMGRSLTDKRHTASYLGSPFISHQVPNGNRLSPRQLDLISHSPWQYLYLQ